MAFEENDKYVHKFRQTRRMIMVRVLLVPFVTLMLVCGTLVYFFGTNIENLVEAELVCIADGHRRLLEQFFKERIVDIKVAASGYPFGQAGGDRFLTETLGKLQKQSRAFFDLGVFFLPEVEHLLWILPAILIIPVEHLHPTHHVLWKDYLLFGLFYQSHL